MKEKRTWRNPKNYIVAVLVSVLVAAATVSLLYIPDFISRGIQFMDSYISWRL